MKPSPTQVVWPQPEIEDERINWTGARPFEELQLIDYGDSGSGLSAVLTAGSPSRSLRRQAVRLAVASRPMPAFRVRLKVEPRSHISDRQLTELRDQPGATVTRRMGDLSVTMLMAGTDLCGALIRIQNIVLRHVPGEIVYAEVILTDEEPPKRRRPRAGERKQRRGGRRSRSGT